MNVSIIKKYQNKISYGVLVLALVSLAVFVIFPLLPQIETSSATQVTTLKAHFSAAFGGDGGGDGGGGDGGGGGGGDGGGCCGGTGGDDGGSTGGGGDSGGGGGDTTPTVTPIWVLYCTGAEGGANDWQWWEKTTNTDPIQYRFVRAGDGACVPPPVDVCPNIDGVQATVPAGMTKDGAGNCITPPTTPSIVGSCVGTDVNISWSGGGPGVLYNYRVDAAASSWTGSCTSLNPGDYCVNNSSATSLSFTGTPGQTYNAWVHAVNTVGVTDAVSVRFSCPAIPTVDVCPNIAGDQATIPAGMIKDTAGNCV
ncbi:hypothetical protein K2X96_03260, partial [Patescibacteria group bacterium]|nr:hypothetical protein [Patescibacteria group bacterium]